MVLNMSRKPIVCCVMLFFLSVSVALAANKNLVFLTLLLGGEKSYPAKSDGSVDSNHIDLRLPAGSEDVADEVTMQTFAVTV